LTPEQPRTKENKGSKISKKKKKEASSRLPVQLPRRPAHTQKKKEVETQEGQCDVKVEEGRKKRLRMSKMVSADTGNAPRRR
jgi:hypothetical protein